MYLASVARLWGMALTQLWFVHELAISSPWQPGFAK